MSSMDVGNRLKDFPPTMKSRALSNIGLPLSNVNR